MPEGAIIFSGLSQSDLLRKAGSRIKRPRERPSALVVYCIASQIRTLSFHVSCRKQSSRKDGCTRRTRGTLAVCRILTESCIFSLTISAERAAGAAGGSDVREVVRRGGAGEEARVHRPRIRGMVRKVAKFDVHFHLENL